MKFEVKRHSFSEKIRGDCRFWTFDHILTLKKAQLESILIFLTHCCFFYSRTFCPFKISKFDVKRYSFDKKIGGELSFLDFRPYFDPKKGPGLTPSRNFIHFTHSSFFTPVYSAPYAKQTFCSVLCKKTFFAERCCKI